MIIGEKVCLSPNIQYKNIDVLPLDECDEIKQEKDYEIIHINHLRIKRGGK